MRGEYVCGVQECEHDDGIGFCHIRVRLGELDRDPNPVCVTLISGVDAFGSLVSLTYLRATSCLVCGTITTAGHAKYQLVVLTSLFDLPAADYRSLCQSPARPPRVKGWCSGAAADADSFHPCVLSFNRG